MSMKTSQEQLTALYEDLLSLRTEVYEDGQRIYQSWDPDSIRESFQPSALNFAYYVALRSHDIRELQIRLANWGLSSLGRLEGQVLPTIDLVLANLSHIADVEDSPYDYPSEIANERGQSRLDSLTEKFVGERDEHRYSRIMVTMPPESAMNYDLVSDMVKEGMNIARINCAHDNPEIWQQMIDNIEKAEKEHNKSIKIFNDIAGPKVRIDAIYTTEQDPRVYNGDSLFLTWKTELKSFYGQSIVLSCEVESVISSLEKGEAIRLDDGKVIGEVSSTHPEGAIIKITQVQKKNGKKIKATKGINFPDREINMPIITDKDKKDLEFAKEHADVIGFSFINKVEDIHEIQNQLTKTFGEEADQVPIVLKIETVGGFKNLVEIIIEANRKNPTGIMIARGDLAVEVGYLRLSVIQEEILWLCEAAQIPVIWSTQVLETLVKSGIPTRAEISDVTMGSRAECVMLNKGSHIIDGIKLLSDILNDIDEHQYKKTPLMKKLNVAQQAFDSLEENN